MNKYKIQKKNGLRDNKGSLQGDADTETGIIRINIRNRKHKNKRELASTIKHEILHVKHPKMTEKEVYKKSAQKTINQSEKRRLLSKLLK